ncbi:hypothetical protein JX265_009687 [Neoarthrinium moseri]|uniref:Major facilitator superfamily (MFS) profile domain-containing protein n=1 Tax=Neoarthrinium moseri TaxID=1658444 RepID=A0A9P9WFC6_9PEZI|nr:hypothetical protein JX265_009687 [Neoarthrinium moseri]
MSTLMVPNPGPSAIAPLASRLPMTTNSLASGSHNNDNRQPQSTSNPYGIFPSWAKKLPVPAVVLPSSPSSSEQEHKDDGGNEKTDAAVVAVAPQDTERKLLKTADCKQYLAFGFPFAKKWLILCILFLCQVSMNLNTTLYSNGITGITEHFGLGSTDAAVWGAAAFLITYAFGCELWAPWSEEFGRKWVLQLSLLLVNAMAVGVALAPGIGSLIAFRALGGLFTAGGSVTLAVITDMFEPHDSWYQYATLFIVFSSVGGSIIGPIAGGFLEVYAPWQWTIWTQLLVGVAVQLLHLVVVPETRATVLTDRLARQWRAGADPEKPTDVYGPGELAERRIDWRETLDVWKRPFEFLVTEPIVLSLALLSGFSDALIFMQVQSFQIVYARWGFGPIELGYTFIPLFIGYIIAALLYIPVIRRGIAQRALDRNDEHAQYEGRLKVLLFLAPLLPVGLLLFGLTATLPAASVHWIGSMVASCIIGIANFAIYESTIEYTLRSYGAYAASATGGNGWARDFLAGVLTPAAVPMYTNFGTKESSPFHATMTLFAISVLLTGSVYWVYFRGADLRRRSRYAQHLAVLESEEGGEVPAFAGPDVLPGSRAASRDVTPAQTPRTTPRQSRDFGALRTVPGMPRARGSSIEMTDLVEAEEEA